MTSKEVKRVQDILDKFGLRNRVVELPSSTKTAREAAGGSPNAVFKLTPQELLSITGGEVICVK